MMRDDAGATVRSEMVLYETLVISGPDGAFLLAEGKTLDDALYIAWRCLVRR